MSRLIFTTVLLLIPTAEVRAAIRPSFWAGYSAWHATHIVVVDQDGKVAESWKGDLKAGQRLDLRPLKIPSKPAVAKWHVKGPNDVAAMTDQRRILFLQREGKQWKPAVSWGGIQVAVVWIEAGQLYAFVQQKNPGPTELLPLAESERDLKAQAAEAAKVQSQLHKAAAEIDLLKRARAIVPFLDNRKLYGPHQESLKLLEGCGAGVLTVLRPILEDESRLRLHSDLILVIGKAGGKEAIPDLEKLVERELTYWKKVAPTLEKWWGEEPMTTHYSRLVSALRQLKAVGYKDERKLVRSLRDYWQSLPQLDYIGKGDLPTSKSQMVEEAEAILGK